MSLSDHLKDAGSPVRAFLAGISPQVAALQGPTSTARAAAASLGLTNLTRSPTLVPSPRDANAATIGTALDIRARIALDGFEARTSASFAGVAKLIDQAGHIVNGHHRAAILSDSFVVAEELLMGAKSETELDLAAVLFAYCEQVFRGEVKALQGSLGDSCDQAEHAHDFVANIDPRMLDDVRALMRSGTGQIDAWKSQIAGGQRFEPNPDFAGSILVDGANGDWVVGETLIDCKVYEQLSVPKLRNFLLQLLGYVMLDLDDALKIRHVGLWLPRQQLTSVWSLENLFGENPDDILPHLRDHFIKSTNPTQVALHIPVTQRRKHQLLADNRHTHSGLLDALANSDDNDIRFRVGRNDVTPEATVRWLARDRYARVREGVAMNSRVPADVLDALSRDSSKVVRMAATSNRGSEVRSAKALGPSLRESGSAAVATLDQQTSASRGHRSPGQGVEINQHRSDWALDAGWLAEFLASALHPDVKRPARLRVPEASQMWSYISDQPFEFPEQLRGGLSDVVKEDLLRGDRPACVRRVVAESLSVSDVKLRTRLLSDRDAAIRWSALERSADQTDDALAELLSKLAGSREARAQFRQDESGTSYWEPTPAELDQQVLQLIAGHPATPHQVLQELIENKRPEVLISLAGNPALRPEDREALANKMLSSRSHAARELFAASTHTPPEVLASFASDRSADVREILADNPRASAKTLTALSADRSPAVRLAVLRNRATPGELPASVARELLTNSAEHELLAVLDVLQRRPDIEVPKTLIENALDDLSKSRVRDPDMRCEAGRDARTSERTLKRLAASADDDVRRTVAGNRSSAVTVLNLLAIDLVPVVRAAAARNERMPISALIELAQDEDVVVRVAAAGNSNLSSGALRVLLTDDDARVRRAARENPSSEAGDVHKVELERQYEPSGPQLTRAELEEMAAHPRAETRIRVAYNKSTPADILKFLGGERRSVKVRRAVAAHSNTPAETLWSLATDKDLEIHQVVALNACTPTELLVDLAGRSIDFALLVALNPGAPDEVLDALAADSDPLLKYVAEMTRANRALTETSGKSARSTSAIEELGATGPALIQPSGYDL